eukprot:scaffold1388_cov390-Prasinococcus_capsulatus_cf.AAC.10
MPACSTARKCRTAILVVHRHGFQGGQLHMLSLLRDELDQKCQQHSRYGAKNISDGVLERGLSWPEAPKVSELLANPSRQADGDGGHAGTQKLSRF